MMIKVFTSNGDNDLFRLGLNTENSTAVDFLGFINDVIELCLKDIDCLERAANSLGRTINHNFKGIGSVPKDPQ